MTPPSERPFSQDQGHAASTEMHNKQPWPEAECWPIVNRHLSSSCKARGHERCGGFLMVDFRRHGARCGCDCHAGQHGSAAIGRPRALVLTDFGREYLAGES